MKAMEFVPAEQHPQEHADRAIKRSGGDAEALAAYEALRVAHGGAGIALAARVRLPDSSPSTAITMITSRTPRSRPSQDRSAMPMSRHPRGRFSVDR